MGWDIAIYAEVLRQGRWRVITSLENQHSVEPGRIDEEPAAKPAEVYCERNSALFAILAGVGHLGGEHSPFPCISPPRGVPADLSPELEALYADRSGLAYCASWLLLEEVLSLPWHRPGILRSAVVDPKIADSFRSASGGQPDTSWPKGVPYGYSHQMLYGRGVEVAWRESCADAVGDEFLGLLLKLQRQASPKEIRMVFWFNF